MQPIISPELWSAETLRAAKSAGRIGDISGFNFAESVSPRDVWNGEDPGSYEEPVMYARLAGVHITKVLSVRDGRTDEFLISRPGFPHRRIELCSPKELTGHVKRYVSDYFKEDV